MLKKVIKHILRLAKRIVFFFFGFIILYLLVAYIGSSISTNPEETNLCKKHEIYVATNRVHSDVILPIEIVNANFTSLIHKTKPNYIAFGWGDKGFYLNTPTWGDLTFSTAVNAVFLKSSTAMHVTEYGSIGNDWKKAMIDDEQLQRLLSFIYQSFLLNSQNEFIKIDSYSYGSTDTFYEAKGNYTCFRTCNTWTNQSLKAADLPTAIWTPFDWGVLKHL